MEKLEVKVGDYLNANDTTILQVVKILSTRCSEDIFKAKVISSTNYIVGYHYFYDFYGRYYHYGAAEPKIEKDLQIKSIRKVKENKMSTKQELLDQIEILKKKVNELDNKEFSIVEDWMKPGKDGYVIDFESDGDITEFPLGLYCDSEFLDNVDKSLNNFGLLFETEAKARDFRYWLEMRNKLSKLAKFLNKGEEIDWDNHNQAKYVINYNIKRKEFNQIPWFETKSPFEVYCLDENFLEEAKKVIGEQELIDFYTNYNI